MRKGISPLIAEVLLIGFTVAVASIVILWGISFTRTTTSTIGNQANVQTICMNAGIDFYGTITYNSTSQTISGYVRNTGNVPLGNISFQVIYPNSVMSFPNQISELLPQNVAYFSLSTVASGFTSLIVLTNCSSVQSPTKIDSSQISFVS
jgi:flagellin-like protein